MKKISATTCLMKRDDENVLATGEPEARYEEKKSSSNPVFI
jgi:hypothetical protein